MLAMVLDEPGGRFELTEMPRPEPGPGELLVRVRACGVCRTDLHVVDGDIRDGRYPVVPGHQIVGTVAAFGAGAEHVNTGDDRLVAGMRVGIPWLGYTCGQCSFCRTGHENLCDSAEFTGYQRPGGFAEYVVADARYCFPLPPAYPDDQVAPLLCAGLIGYRALAMAGDAFRIGFYGFGSAAHILTQIAAWEGRQVYALTRPGDQAGQTFARSLGAVWAGDSDQPMPELLDAAIIFAPDGRLVPRALQNVRKGGVVVCAGIHMTDIPSFPYHDLWGERTIRSVANLTRDDGRRLLTIAPQVPVRTHVAVFPLSDTARALDALRDGRIQGAAVISLGA
jgi:alcohol dehydrogenase, propanol-preferring